MKDKKLKTFEINDRVSFWVSGFTEKQKGIVVSVCFNSVDVKNVGTGITFSCHPNDLTKLVKKPKPEAAKEYWIYQGPDYLLLETCNLEITRYPWNYFILEILEI